MIKGRNVGSGAENWLSVPDVHFNATVNEAPERSTRKQGVVRRGPHRESTHVR